MLTYLVLLELDQSLAWDFIFQDSASFNADGIQYLHDTIMFYLVFVLISVTWIMYRVISYFTIAPNRVRRYLVDKHSVHGQLLELLWTVTPAIVLLLIALPSFRLLYVMDEIIDPLVSIKAIGRQWYWTYEYSDYPLSSHAYDSYIIPDAELSLGNLRVLEVDHPLILPIDTHIRLLTTATDVMHSVGVPSLGLKSDAIPGRLNQVSLYIYRSSTFYGQCSELCGTGHAFMPIVVKATSLDSYLHWLRTFTTGLHGVA
jgi:cytochrome c oxidase subunit 2